MALAIYGFLPLPQRRIEPAGISYEANALRDRILFGQPTFPVLQITLEELDKLQHQTDEDLAEDVDWIDKEDAKYLKYVSKLDPNEAKEQDHYKVLGLSKLRSYATAAQIKLACRSSYYAITLRL